MATAAEQSVLEPPSTVSPQTLRYRLYLSILVLLPIACALLACPIARTDYFERVSRRMFWHSMQYHIDMAGQPCEVVVFGDSTGLTGIDPKIVRQQTGLQACVLAMPYMAISTTGNYVLDHFLSRSPAPRLIVFAEHARHLRTPALDEDPGVIDGWLLEDRVRPPLQAAWFFLRHPRSSIIFMEGIWEQVFTLSNVGSLDLTERTYRRDMETLRQGYGYFAIPTLGSRDVVCGMKLDVPPDDPGYLPSLRARYENATTKVLFYVSPVRSCDDNVAAYRAPGT